MRISDVAGFYSEWSPSITTDKIKILTDNSEHKVEGAPEDFILRRIGEVGEAELYFIREITLPFPAAEPDEAGDVDFGPDDRPVDRATPPEIAREKQAQEIVKLLQNLRIAAWAAALLLLVLLLK